MLLKNSPYHHDEPIAVVGFASRLPHAESSPLAFWELIKNGRSATTTVPKTRSNIDAFYHPDSERTNTSNVRSGNFLESDISAFDASFFSIGPSEAESMDPQQRLLLETSYHALENAGLPIESVAGSNTSVFVATSSHDYEILLHRDPEQQPKYMGTGTGQAMLANRLSWFYNFQAPSVTLDTACSGSLVALHLACQSLRLGESSAALVGGVSLVVAPDLSMNQLSTLGFLSPDGRSYCFDARANGYAKGEGVTVVVLKRLSDAIANGDTIRSIIRATTVNQDGRTPGISQPSRKAQAENIAKAYSLAGLNPAHTQYFEAHGTGTAVGDPLEAGAIYDAFRRPSSNPICVGGLKANIGHLEGGAGLAALVKATLMLEHGIMPPISGFTKLNPAIPAASWGLKFLSTAIPFDDKLPRRISINSFGFGGTNGHTIVDDALSYLRDNCLNGKHSTVEVCEMQTLGARTQEANESNGPVSAPTNGHAEPHRNGHTKTLIHDESRQQEPDCVSVKEQPIVLLWSAADEAGISRLTESFQRHFETHIQPYNPHQYLLDLSHTLSQRRSNLPWKAFSIVNQFQDLKDLVTRNCSKPLRSSISPTISYVFNGQGSQWAAMAYGLGSNFAFQASLVKSRDYLKALGCDWDAIDELHKDPNLSRVDEPQFTQPLCTILQIALVDFFSSLNIKPIAVVGHSSGEIAAAYAVAAISHQAAIKIAYHRGLVASKVLANPSLRGGMISVALSRDEIIPVLKDIEKDTGSTLSIACINSPRNVTISGDVDGIDLLLALMERRCIFARKLNVDVAYHSHHLQTVAEEYAEALGKLEGCQIVGDNLHMFSSVTGDRIDASILLSAKYWTENLVSTVKFSAAVSTMVHYLTSRRRRARDTRSGRDILLEVGPHSTLQRSIQDTLVALPDVKDIDYDNSLVRNVSSLLSLSGLIGRLRCKGCLIDVSRVLSRGEDAPLPMTLSDLPAYPFNQETKYWYESRLSKNMRFREYPKHDFLGVREADWNVLLPRWRNVIKLSEHPWIHDHQIERTTLYPGSAMLVTAIEGFRELSMHNLQELCAYQLEDITFISNLQVPKDSTCIETQLVLRATDDSNGIAPSSYRFEVFGHLEKGWTRLCDGKIRSLNNTDHTASQLKRLGLSNLLTTKSIDKLTSLNIGRFYDAIQPQGYHLGTSFQKLSDGHMDDLGNGLSSIFLSKQEDASSKNSLSPHLIHPADLDAIFQTSVFVRSNGGRNPIELLIPTKIKSVFISTGLSQLPQASALKIATRATSTSFREAEFAMAATTAEGNVQVFVESFRQTFIANSTAKTILGNGLPRSCYHVDWKPDIDLMTSPEIFEHCSENVQAQDTDESIKDAVQQELVCLHFMTLASEQISPARRCALPAHLKKYMDWIDWRLHSEATKSLLKHPDFAILKGTREQCEAYLQSFVETCDPGRLIVETGKNLMSVLNGQRDALELLFSDDLVSDFYSGPFFAAIFERLTSCIALLAHKNPSMKILEVGAGTGSATSKILNRLSAGNPPSFDSYTYTDVSPAFFEQAKQKFTAQGHRMIYAVLDMEKDVVEQGFSEGQYDLIVCSAVLHVAANLQQTMTNIRKLLKTGGKILIIEPTAPETCRVSFSFGLLPGWWASVDKNRSWGPLLDVEGWNNLMQTAGFSPLQTQLPDYPHPTATTFTGFMSSATDIPDCPVPPNVDIVFDPKVTSQEVLAASVATILAKNKYTTNCVMISDWLETGAGNNICIFLLEIERTFWNEISEVQWHAFKRSLASRKTIIWTTQATIGTDQEPFLSIVTGMGRAIRSEMPHLQFLELKIDCGTPSLQIEKHLLSIINRYVFCSSTNEDAEFVEKKGKLHVSRLYEATQLNTKILQDKGLAEPAVHSLSMEQDRPLSLTIRSPGQLDSLVLVDDPDYETPLGLTEVKVQVMATGINFKDILLSMGQAGGSRLGFEFAGVVVEAGPQSDFVQGDRVCGATLSGAYKTTARADSSALVRIPSHFSFTAAAAIPMAYATAYYSLINLANLQPGESVLIHSGSGGVGQAAINIALSRNARIFVTVGSSKKKELLMDLYRIPEDHIFSSRNSEFAGKLKSILETGVDVVLNSLKGELQTASWSCLAPLGRFIEIGKADIEDTRKTLSLTPFAQNVSFSSVSLDIVMQKSKPTIRRIMDSIGQLLTEGTERLVPQPLQIYQISHVEEAFRHMQSGTSSGKLVVEWSPDDKMPILPTTRPRFYFDPEATYLIAGGLGGLGRAIVEWMISRKARYFILLSRSGASKSLEISQWIGYMESRGITIQTPRCDVADAAALSLVLEKSRQNMPPVKGCIQASMVLKDALIENLLASDVHTVLNPKTHGTINLHQLLPKDMDFFVILSSLSGLAGSRGQSSYAAAGTFQDAFARYRIRQGQKCVCIDLGAVTSVGYAAEHNLNAALRNDAFEDVDKDEFFSLLDYACDPDCSGAMDLDRTQVVNGLASAETLAPEHFQSVYWTKAAIFRPLVQLSKCKEMGLDSNSVSAGLEVNYGALLADAETTEEQAEGLALMALVDRMAKLMAVPKEDIDLYKPINSLGIDSLVALEVKYWIMKELRADISVIEIVNSSDLIDLATSIVARSDLRKKDN